jgi:hypothetical protein
MTFKRAIAPLLHFDASMSHSATIGRRSRRFPNQGQFFQVSTGQWSVVDFSGWKIRVIDASEQGLPKTLSSTMATTDICFALLLWLAISLLDNLILLA